MSLIKVLIHHVVKAKDADKKFGQSFMIMKPQEKTLKNCGYYHFCPKNVHLYDYSLDYSPDMKIYMNMSTEVENNLNSDVSFDTPEWDEVFRRHFDNNWRKVLLHLEMNAKRLKLLVNKTWRCGTSTDRYVPRNGAMYNIEGNIYKFENMEDFTLVGIPIQWYVTYALPLPNNQQLIEEFQEENDVYTRLKTRLKIRQNGRKKFIVVHPDGVDSYELYQGRVTKNTGSVAAESIRTLLSSGVPLWLEQRGVYIKC